MDGWTEIAYSAFGLSVLVSAAQIGKWALHANPRVIADAGRWALLVLGGLAVAALVWLGLNGRWTQAMMLAAFVMPVFVQGAPRWRALLAPLLARRRSRRATKLDLGADATVDPELVRRSIAVLTRYLDEARQVAGYRPNDPRLGNGAGRARMPAGEAFAVLGLEPGADPEEIRNAHCRLRRQLAPETGGTRYLATKIDEARDVLLDRP